VARAPDHHGSEQRGGKDDPKLTEWIQGLTAFFGFVLTISILGVYRQQRTIMERQQKLQLAWIFGGIGGAPGLWGDPTTGVTFHGPGGFPVLVLTPGYHNYGATPAWVIDLTYVLCAESLPDVPDYASGRTLIISDSSAPDGNVRNIPNSPIFIEIPTETIMIYGRFRYLDALRQERYSGFIYRLRDDGKHDRVHDAPAAYLDWN